MATFKDIINDVIFESSNKYLKCFYTVEVHIDEANKDIQQNNQAPQQIQQTPEVQAPAPDQSVVSGNQQAPQPDEQVDKTTKPIIEEVIDFPRKSGFVVIQKEDVLQINNIGQLISKLSNSDHVEQNSLEKIFEKPGTKKNGNVLNEFTADLILVAIGYSTEKKLSDIVGKNDSFFFDISYGVDKENSVGLLVSKSKGDTNFSISLKQNGEVIDAAFNLQALNSQIIYYRNLMGD